MLIIACRFATNMKLYCPVDCSFVRSHAYLLACLCHFDFCLFICSLVQYYECFNKILIWAEQCIPCFSKKFLTWAEQPKDHQSAHVHSPGPSRIDISTPLKKT